MIQLLVEHISKDFGAGPVLKDVCFSAQSGDVIAICGENGAGKSTLMKIIAGLIPSGQYGGNVLRNGEPIVWLSVNDAMVGGIFLANQELSLFPHWSVLENIASQRFARSQSLRVHWDIIKKSVSEYLDTLGWNLPLNALAEELTPGQRQLTELSRVLFAQGDVIIFDEPTTSLTQTETDQLFRVIHDLKKSEKIIFYITHRMEEVFKICNRVMILRDGMMVGDGDVKDFDLARIHQLMMGRETKGSTVKTKKSETPDAQRMILLEAGPLQVRSHQIVGIGGMMGSGRTEFLQGVLGLKPSPLYKTQYCGKPTQWGHPSDFIEAGVSYLSEDRKLTGLLLDQSCQWNLLLSLFGKIPAKQYNSKSQILWNEGGILGPGLQAPMASFSGGNQQKAYLSRCLSTKPKLLILDEPTRGVDVGAKAEIYTKIKTLAAQGLGVLVVSSDFEELNHLCDLLWVMKDHQLMGQLIKTENGGTRFSGEKFIQLALSNTNANALNHLQRKV